MNIVFHVRELLSSSSRVAQLLNERGIFILTLNGHMCVDLYNFQIWAQIHYLYQKMLCPLSSENQLNAQDAVTEISGIRL